MSLLNITRGINRLAAFCTQQCAHKQIIWCDLRRRIDPAGLIFVTGVPFTCLRSSGENVNRFLDGVQLTRMRISCECRPDPCTAELSLSPIRRCPYDFKRQRRSLTTITTHTYRAVPKLQHQRFTIIVPHYRAAIKPRTLKEPRLQETDPLSVENVFRTNSN